MSESDEIVKAELADTPTVPPQPPLSISHLLLWILGSAVVLGCYRWLEMPDQWNAARRGLFVVEQFLRSVTMGGGVAGLIVYVRRWHMRDAPLPMQPGHFLLALQGLVGGLYVAALLTVYGPWGSRDAAAHTSAAQVQFVFVTILLYAIAGCLYLLTLIWLRKPPRWQIFFATSGGLSLIHALTWCCLASGVNQQLAESLIVPLRFAVMLTLIAVCVLRDRSASVPRDWMHAAGVAFYVTGVLTSLLTFVAAMLLPR